jgi:predicted ATPase
VRIRNFKSIAYCDVELGPLTVLVGRNGSGKSNFLEALGLVSNALRMTFRSALKASSRSVVPRDLWRKGTSLPMVFMIELEVDLRGERWAVYSLEVGRDDENLIWIVREGLEIKEDNDKVKASYEVRNGVLVHPSVSPMPKTVHTHLHLEYAGGLPEFSDVYDALLGMAFYSFNPESMRKIQDADANAGEILDRDGGNVASVVGRIAREQPELRKRILEYLALIVPGVTSVDRKDLAGFETIEFTQQIPGSDSSWKFFASSISDGTLHTLGALVAATQLAERTGSVRLVGIEEPETAIHPAAAAALMGALQEAAVDGQVIVTTHSPDLIDQIDLDADRLLVVEIRDGETVIAPIDQASRNIVKKQLYTLGELLQMNQLEPDGTILKRQKGVLEFTGPSE